MNSYGAMALDHWATWRPSELAEIADPEAFFRRLGDRVSDEIDQMTFDLAGPDQRGEGYLGKLGRLNMARFTAEEVVLRELVLLPPENADPDDMTGTSDDDADDEEGWRGLGRTPWLPVRTGPPSDPAG